LPNDRAPRTSVRHQLRRHPNDPLPGEQITLRPAREVTAILHRPAPLPALASLPKRPVRDDRPNSSPSCAAPTDPAHRLQRPCGCACAPRSRSSP
jgi:hypothetical protein